MYPPLLRFSYNKIYFYIAINSVSFVVKPAEIDATNELSLTSWTFSNFDLVGRNDALFTGAAIIVIIVVVIIVLITAIARLQVFHLL